MLRHVALHLVVLLAITASLTTVHAQGTNPTTLIGEVADEAGTPLAFANVQLLAAADSSLVQGTLAEEDGTFTLERVRAGRYVLHVSLIGYQPFLSDVIPVDRSGTVDVGTVTLQQGTVKMDEVSIEAKRTTYEQKGDRLVINIGTSVTFAGESALEVLRRSPGVTVNEQSGTISLVGKDGVNVLVNGKRSYVPADGLTQFLAGISADNIQSIELITSPSADLDAEGNAGFINVVLKEGPTGGLNGSVSVSGGYGQGEIGNASANMNYRAGRVGFHASYSGLLFGQFQNFQNERTLTNGDGVIRSVTNTDRDPRRINHDGRLALDYDLTQKTTVGGLVAAYNHKWTMDALNEMGVHHNGTPQTTIESDNDEINHWRHAMGNVYVERALPGDASLRADLDYVYYHDNNPTNYRNTVTDLETGQVEREQLGSGKRTPLRIWVGKADYKRSWQDTGELAVGVKGAFSRFTNEATYEGLVEQAWVEDAGLASRSVLNEDVWAAYGSAKLPIGEDVTLKLGLRYEYTDSNLRSDEQADLVDRQFGRFFPSASYTHALTENQKLNAAYTRRITRPSFNSIAPFLYFIDPFTFFTGNTALQPSTMNAVKVGYGYKNWLVSVEYAWEDSTIARFQNHFLEEDNVQMVFSRNLKQSRQVTALAALPVEITGWWSTQNNVTGVWTEVQAYRDDALVDMRHTSVYVNSTQNIRLPSQFSFEASGFYRSGVQFGQIRMKSLWSVDLGLQRTLPRGFGKLTVGVNDVFDSNRWRFEDGDPGDPTYVRALIDVRQRAVKLTYSLRFGDGNASQNRTTASSDERRRVQ